jgi:ppGpp synthetase/RelA/SpoT-type nucleotidyltranferase
MRLADMSDVVPPLTDPEIDRVVSEYVPRMARYEEAALLVEQRLRRELRANAIRSMLSSRAKHPDDLREKLTRKRTDARYAYSNLSTTLESVVTDLAGCRVLVYRLEDQHKAFELVRRVFTVPPVRNAIEHHDRPSGYRAIHVLVRVGDDEERFSLRGAVCEIQIASFGAHVFNELEHDIAYKDHECPPTGAEREILDDLRCAARLIDRAAERLMLARGDSVVRQTRVLTSAEDLQLVLERAAGRKLHGEFDRLFKFLNIVLEPLTAATVAALGPIAELLSAGEQRAKKASLEYTDDVMSIALALTDRFAPELRESVRSQRGRPTLFKKSVEQYLDWEQRQ